MNILRSFENWALVFVCIMISICAKAQNNFVRIAGVNTQIIDSTMMSFEEALPLLQSLKGDTIMFIGNSPRKDFYNLNPDTVWIRKGAKKSKFGKDYDIQKKYQGERQGNEEVTPAIFIYNIPWIIKDVIKNEEQGSFGSNDKYLYFLFKNVESGKMVEFNFYRHSYFSEPFKFVDLSKSDILSREIKKYPLFSREGTSFQPIGISLVKCIFNFNHDYIGGYTSVTLYNGKEYHLTKNSSGTDEVFYTEESKKDEINSLAKEGSYYLELYKVKKPLSSRIKFGKLNSMIDKDLTIYSYEDNVISISWLPSKEQIDFSLVNKSGNSIKIIWDDAAYIDIENSSSRVLHKGVKYINREKSQIATVVPDGATLNDVVCPSDNIKYIEDWISYPLVWGDDGGSKENKIIKVLLPISIKGVKNEYTFYFRLKWKGKYPELQNR